MNNENLIPQNQRTQRERKEISRKGAKEANKNKQIKKTHRKL